MGKLEFSERFYSFKSSDKVAVIPLKRETRKGHHSYHWSTRWCKRTEDSAGSSSESDSELEVRGRDWADGTVDFQDGQDTAEVRIPLTKAPMPAVPRKRSFFWLHVVDQTSKKRMATMRVKLVDDKEYGEVGFQETNIHLSGASDSQSKQLIPVSREFGATGKAIIQWSVRQSEIADKYIRGPMKGEVTFFSGSQESSIPLQLASDWADHCYEPEEVYIDLVSIKQGAYLKKEKLTCILSFVPGPKLSAPKNLKVECGGSSSINISWDAEGDGAESYVVYYKLDTDKEPTEQKVP